MDNVIYYKPDEDDPSEVVFGSLLDEYSDDDIIIIRTGEKGAELLSINMPIVNYYYASPKINVFAYEGKCFNIVVDDALANDSVSKSPFGGESAEYSIIIERGLQSFYMLPLELKLIEYLTDEDKDWCNKHNVNIKVQ